MQVRSLYTKVSPGVRIPLLAEGGVPPYIFSSDKGTMTPEGVLTMPDELGDVTVTVTDQNLDVATLIITALHPLQLVGEILKQCMNLSDEQTYLFNQKFMVPKDDKIYIAISQLTSKVYGNSRRLDEQTVNIFSPLDITIHSRSIQALFRKEEVVLALTSDVSRRFQEMNSFSLGKVSGSIVPLNVVEGPAIPYAFNISINMKYAVTQKVIAQFYDQFQGYDILTNP